MLREIAISTDTAGRRAASPREVAETMVGAWDPWCVAEDADIAGWLARSGHLVAMITDSWTLEEAPISPSKAARQRARWGKGYAQAGAVQSRHPAPRGPPDGDQAAHRLHADDDRHAASLMLNPVFWGLTIAYFLTHSAFIQGLFPAAVFYLGALTAVIGNFILFYLQVAACLRDSRTGAGEVHAGPGSLVALHQLFDVEGHHRALHPQAQVPLARHRTRHRRPGNGRSGDPEAAPGHVGPERFHWLCRRGTAPSNPRDGAKLRRQAHEEAGYAAFLDHVRSRRRSCSSCWLFRSPRTAAQAQTQDSWTTSLHDNSRDGASTDTVIPASEAPALTRLWSYSTGGPIASQPAIVNGVAYVGSWDGYEYALNATTGAVIWKTLTGITTGNSGCNPPTAGISSAATVLNGVVYVGGGDAYWYALDALPAPCSGAFTPATTVPAPGTTTGRAR